MFNNTYSSVQQSRRHYSTDVHDSNSNSQYSRGCNTYNRLLLSRNERIVCGHPSKHMSIVCIG